MAEVALPERLSPAVAAGRRVGRSIKLVRQYPILPLSVLIIVLVLPAVFATQLAPHDPIVNEITERLTPPFWVDAKVVGGLDQPAGSWNHPLGTDKLGRDILSRMMHGARISLIVAVVSIFAGGLVGTTLGLLAGYWGGWWDHVIMRLVDIKLSLPSILLALVLVAAMGPSFATVIIVIALVLWTRYARLVRGEVLSLRAQDFVARAKVSGCSTPRILFRHLFPNVTNTIIVIATLEVGQVILLESTLSFLGAGIPLPTPAWGLMVADGRALIVVAWWVAFFPGLAILLTVLSMNLMGDWLRDRLDPKLRNV